MTDLEREAIEFLKDGVIVRTTNNTRDEFVKEYSYSSKTLILQLIQKQDTEINKLNNVIDDLVGEVGFLNYETIGEWCNKDKGDKCKNCDTNNHDCIKEYFMKDNTGDHIPRID